ncbi:MAG: ferredoxin family protein [Nitrosopumilus sp.]|jgi:NAD-dependent dihydropyrimidine dehydrogenase PreA subunit|nr:ferredoxin family protein [Nitrosopumilus sp.]MDH3501118.1 ferredoxin family protein [Nitrosopumilus sp.]
MPIDEKFVENLEVVGKTSHADGENKHFIWGKGKSDGSAFSNEQVKAAYEAHGEEQVPLGIHGTTVAVDWDDCTAQGSCMSVCPVQTFQWYRTEKDISAAECLNATFEGTGKTEQDERLDYSDKSMPIREHDCTQCMACQEACPEKAILIEPSYQRNHEEADGTFVKMESGSVNPHAHD